MYLDDDSQGLEATVVTPDSWKCAGSKNLSQTTQKGIKQPKKLQSEFDPIGTGILEVCEKSKRLADRFKWSYRVSEGQIRKKDITIVYI